LEAFQVLAIQRGGGWFESAATGRIRLDEGTVFLLFPGIWHRYAPDRRTGWTESWIEFEGPVPERLRTTRMFDVARPVYPGALSAEVAQLVRSCHDLADVQPPGFAGQLAASALQMLSLVVATRAEAEQPPSQVRQLVRRAKIRLLEGFDEGLRIREVARELGISESHLRRVFKANTGLSPKEYLLNLRLRQVRILLRGSALTLGEIAARTGYDSAYHLSAEFKKRVGIAPSRWRAERRGKAGESANERGSFSPM
jgi:AraC-like DNA-binding protein